MGVVGAQDAGAVVEVLLEQFDGLVEPARVLVGVGEVWGAWCFSDKGSFSSLESIG